MEQKKKFRVLLKEDASNLLAKGMMDAGIADGQVNKADHSLTTQGSLSADETADIFLSVLGRVKEKITGLIVVVISEMDDENRIYACSEIHVQPAGLEPLAQALVTSVVPALEKSSQDFKDVAKGMFNKELFK
jgi:hypothetical protein